MTRRVYDRAIRSRFLALWRAGTSSREIEHTLNVPTGTQATWRRAMGLPHRSNGGLKAVGKQARMQWTQRRCEDCGSLTLGSPPCGVCGAPWKGAT